VLMKQAIRSLEERLADKASLETSAVSASASNPTGRKARIPKPSAATMTCEHKMRCISVARIFIRGITLVGVARMATAIPRHDR
jgi:hypothetical protein